MWVPWCIWAQNNWPLEIFSQNCIDLLLFCTSLPDFNHACFFRGSPRTVLCILRIWQATFFGYLIQQTLSLGWPLRAALLGRGQSRVPSAQSVRLSGASTCFVLGIKQPCVKAWMAPVPGIPAYCVLGRILWKWDCTPASGSMVLNLRQAVTSDTGFVHYHTGDKRPIHRNQSDLGPKTLNMDGLQKYIPHICVFKITVPFILSLL